jgi:ABC-type antimicrobial peptide transport system permease subunit
MLLAGAGVTIGAVASFMVSKRMGSMLFGIQPTDALTFAAMAAILLTVAALAAFVPARRASSTDPLRASIRHDRTRLQTGGTRACCVLRC